MGMDPASIAAIAAVVSATAGAGALLMPKPKAPELPTPAAAAPAARTETDATVAIGSEAIKNQRITGSQGNSKKTDVLGVLGKGVGLSL